MRLVLLAALLVAAAGCREAVVNEPLVPPDPTPAAAVAPLYIKGIGDTIGIRSEAQLRGENHRAAVGYEWDAEGAGVVRFRPGVEPRMPRVEAVSPGWVELRVVAYDAAGVIVGRGARTVQVVE